MIICFYISSLLKCPFFIHLFLLLLLLFVVRVGFLLDMFVKNVFSQFITFPLWYVSKCKHFLCLILIVYHTLRLYWIYKSIWGRIDIPITFVAQIDKPGISHNLFGFPLVSLSTFCNFQYINLTHIYFVYPWTLFFVVF